MNTLESFFQWLLAASLRASLLAGAVVCLQLGLRRWLPARWRFALWLPVVLVLVAPVLPESRFSVQNRFVENAVPAVINMEQLPAMEISASEAIPVATPIVIENRWTPRQRILAVWLFGTATVFIVGLLGYRRSMRCILREALEMEPALVEAVSSVAAELRLRRMPRVVVSKSVGSPAVAGLLRPMLLLPADFPAEFSPAESRLVLMHELTHLKRRDLPMNWLMCVLQALHWFNPLLWFVFLRMRNDREAACDAQVLAANSADCRADYGHALLKLQAAPRHAGLSLAFVGIFERNAALRARIQSIAAHRPAHPAWSLVVVCIMAALTMVGATRAESKKDAPPAADAQNEQVQISAKFVEITAGARKGFTITGETADFTKKDGISGFIQSEMNVAELVEQFDKSWIVASPTIIAPSGQRAKIEVLREFAIPVGDTGKTENKPVGISLEVTPTVDAGNIILVVSATISKLTDPATGKEIKGEFKSGTKADYSEQKLNTTIALKPGQSATIGGVLNGNDSKTLMILTPKLIRNGAAAPQKEAKRFAVPGLVYEGNNGPIASFYVSSAPKATLAEGSSVEVQFEEFEAIKFAGKVSFVDPKTDPASGLTRVKVAFDAKDDRIKVGMKCVGSFSGGKPKAAEAKAKSIIIPKVSFVDASVDECVEYLVLKAKELDPEKKGINVIVVPAVRGKGGITLSLADISVFDALRFVAKLAGADLQNEDALITIAAVNVGEKNSEKEKSIEVFERLGRELAIYRKQNGIVDPDPYSADALVSLDTGSEAKALLNEYIKRKSELIHLMKTGTDTMPIRDAKAANPPKKPTKSDLVLPALDLKEASIHEAVATIIESSKAVDPEKEGVRVTVYPNADAGLGITLALKDVTVGDALKLIGQLSNAKLSGQKNNFAFGTLPFGIPVPGKRGFVFSPYKPDGEIDIRGLPKGTELECPYTQKPLLVP